LAIGKIVSFRQRRIWAKQIYKRDGSGLTQARIISVKFVSRIVLLLIIREARRG
jgi:hypothetical protein